MFKILLKHISLKFKPWIEENNLLQMKLNSKSNSEHFYKSKS